VGFSCKQKHRLLYGNVLSFLTIQKEKKQNPYTVIVVTTISYEYGPSTKFRAIQSHIDEHIKSL